MPWVWNDGKGEGKGKGWSGTPGGWGWGSKGKGRGRGRPRELQVDPSLKVWVGDLPEGVKWKELQEHMDKAGKTKWVEVLPGKGKGTAAVAYGTAEEAQAAIATLNGSEFAGQNIVVDVWVKMERPAADDAPAEAPATSLE